MKIILTLITMFSLLGGYFYNESNLNLRELKLDSITSNISLKQDLIDSNISISIKKMKKEQLILGQYNSTFNNISVFVTEREFNLSDKELLSIYRIQETLTHELLHSIFKNNKELKEKIFKELKENLKKEEPQGITNENNFFRYTKYIENILKDKFFFLESRKEDVYYQEILCYFYMKGSNQDKYPEISDLLFKK